MKNSQKIEDTAENRKEEEANEETILFMDTIQF
jgi:hypothetical protein